MVGGEGGSVPDQALEQAGECSAWPLSPGRLLLSRALLPILSCCSRRQHRGNYVPVCFPSCSWVPTEAPTSLLGWTFPLPNGRGPHTSS